MDISRPRNEDAIAASFRVNGLSVNPFFTIRPTFPKGGEEPIFRALTILALPIRPISLISFGRPAIYAPAVTKIRSTVYLKPKATS